MNKIITAQNAPAAVGPYSHAVLAGNTVYTSGQLGADPKTGELGSGVEEQAKLAFQNLIAVLRISLAVMRRHVPAYRLPRCRKAPCLKLRR